MVSRNLNLLPFNIKKRKKKKIEVSVGQPVNTFSLSLPASPFQSLSRFLTSCFFMSLIQTTIIYPVVFQKNHVCFTVLKHIQTVLQVRLSLVILHSRNILKVRGHPFISSLKQTKYSVRMENLFKFKNN